jgi:hypothetical protein
MNKPTGAEAARRHFDLLLRLLAAEGDIAQIRISMHCFSGGVSDVTFSVEGAARRRPPKGERDLTEQVQEEFEAMMKEVEERRYTGMVSLTAMCMGNRVYKIRKGLESYV